MSIVGVLNSKEPELRSAAVDVWKKKNHVEWFLCHSVERITDTFSSYLKCNNENLLLGVWIACKYCA